MVKTAAPCVPSVTPPTNFVSPSRRESRVGLRVQRLWVFSVMIGEAGRVVPGRRVQSQHGVMFSYSLPERRIRQLPSEK